MMKWLRNRARTARDGRSAGSDEEGEREMGGKKLTAFIYTCKDSLLVRFEINEKIRFASLNKAPLFAFLGARK